MLAFAIGIRPQQAMALAFAICAAEKSSRFSTPRHHCELIDGPDQHRRRPMVDFLVDHNDRETGSSIFPAEFALRSLVAAKNGCSPDLSVHVNISTR
jgi:hypothetical protein